MKRSRVGHCRLGVLPALALAMLLCLPTAGYAVAGSQEEECTPAIDVLRQIQRLAVPLANDPARWNTRPALDRWLNAASYHDPVRVDRYQIDARHIDALIAWLRGPQGRSEPGGNVLARALLLPQLESFASSATGACTAASGDPALRARLAALSRAWLDFELEVYQRPEAAELIKRLQASRRRIFTLLRQAPGGDGAAAENLRGLAQQASTDTMTLKAAAFYDELEAIRQSAIASGKAAAAAALSPTVHTAMEAAYAIQQTQAADNLRMLGILQPLTLVLVEHMKATAREEEMRAACGWTSSDSPPVEVAQVSACRRRWEEAHPVEE